jgi:hypothetical protein
MVRMKLEYMDSTLGINDGSANVLTRSATTNDRYATTTPSRRNSTIILRQAPARLSFTLLLLLLQVAPCVTGICTEGTTTTHNHHYRRRLAARTHNHHSQPKDDSNNHNNNNSPWNVQRRRVALQLWKDRSNTDDFGSTTSDTSDRRTRPWHRLLFFSAASHNPRNASTIGSTSRASSAMKLFLWRGWWSSTEASDGSSSITAQQQQNELHHIPMAVPLMSMTTTTNVSTATTTVDVSIIHSNGVHVSNGKRIEDSNNDQAATDRSAGPIHIQQTPLSQPSSSSSSTATNNNNDNNSNNNNINGKNNSTQSSMIRVYTYRDPRTGHIWQALHTGRRKFQAFLQYQGVWTNTSQLEHYQVSLLDTPSSLSSSHHQLQQQQSSWQHRSSQDAAVLPTIASCREEWRQLWKQGRLLTDRTEWLAVYPSDQSSEASSHDNNSAHKSNNKDKNSKSSRHKPKRGGFSDLLAMYTERMTAILRDEQMDATLPITNGEHHHDEHQEHHSQSIENDSTSASPFLLQWLRQHYGVEATERIQHSQVRQLSETEQVARFRHFLTWFRNEFPYYYDRCQSCGASLKEDGPPALEDTDGSLTPPVLETHDDDVSERQHDHQSFVGYMYPNSPELTGKASRTELYQCHKCRSFTRFPRYNAATHILHHRKGRCGEYSMLLYRFLRSLGHESRWVIDWADHVWAEVRVTHVHASSNSPLSFMTHTPVTTARWVHLDPCEAAVDENLIYQQWGKKQTYILAFYAPLRGAGWTAPAIQDVTAQYTTDSWAAIHQRRDETPDEIRQAIGQASIELKERIQSEFVKCHINGGTSDC